MREQWRKLSERFNAFQKRERMLVLVGVVLGTAMFYDLLFLEPLLAGSKRQVQHLASANRNLTAVQDQLKALRMGGDPGAARRVYRDALQKQLAQLDRDMKNLQVGLVPPERMAQLLQEMLGRTRGTKLVSIRTLPVQRFESARAGAKAQKGAKAESTEPKRAIYQHSVVITLQGSYVDLYHYVAQLEKLPWRMFWHRLDVNTEQHPRLRVTLTVRTMSLNKAWLVV